MAIDIRILGKRGADNVLLVSIDTGQQVSRLLMDCGGNTVSELTFSESSQIDHVLFSHFHMDHVTGFDSFFRRHYERTDRSNHIWGPPGTMEIMHHRFRGYLWNLVAGRHAQWHCHDIDGSDVRSARFELAEGFAQVHPEQSDSQPTGLFSGPGYRVEAITLNHGTPSIGYIVREDDRRNVDTSRLRALGLKPGPWLKTLATDTVSIIDGSPHDPTPLRESLLVTTPGASMAFLTDFIADSPQERERIATHIQGISTLICECQYRAADEELARKNFHMTTQWVARLATAANVQRLRLTHFSDRYQPNEWDEMLSEVRAIFPNVEAEQK